MRKRAHKVEDYIQSQGGVVRFSAILKAGFHSDSLTALKKQGKIEKIARGLYRLTNKPLEPHPDLIAASLQAPRGVICLLSALAFYEVTNEIPRHVNIAIPRSAHANRITYPPAKFYRFAPEAWKAGVEEHKIGNHTLRIYGLAKTIADCFKFRNQIGVNVARDALKAAMREKGIEPKEIMRYAGICRVDKIMKPILEAML